VRRPDGSDRAKLIDFGISHVPARAGAERLTRDGAIIGTPEYMAPEQAAGRAVDHRTDVYALGILAFEMLTGALPISGATPIAMLIAHQTQTPEPPSKRVPGIPVEVDALVLRALAKRPEDRFESMHAFAAEVAFIRAKLAGPGARAPVTRRAPGATAPLPAPATETRAGLFSRRGARAAFAVVSAVAVLAVLAALAVRWRPGATTARGDAAAAAPAALPAAPAASAVAAASAPLPAVEPALVVERPRPAMRPDERRRSAPAPRRAAARSPNAVEEHSAADPYGSAGRLKDPFE
jgi:serine/threonine-protein kinase